MDWVVVDPAMAYHGLSENKPSTRSRFPNTKAINGNISELTKFNSDRKFKAELGVPRI